MATRKIPKKETLGRFRILREIGRGGSGVVYEGWDPRERRKVALKVLPAIRALDSDRVRRFLREAETARNLHHERIVSLYEIGEERGTYFIAMQYIEGRPLDLFWKEELIDFRTSVNVVIQCLDALEYAHDKGLVHLDVKPQNILVDDDGRAYLADFGLARGVTGLRQTGALAGTPKYMSPEQAAGRPAVDVRSDIYSLGLTLYNLLTYTHPFEGEDVHLVLKNVISGDFPRPRDINNRIPARLEAVVLKAMERKPSRRYATAAEFRADLQSVLKGESVTASVPMLKRRGLRLLGARRLLYGILFLALASVGALLARQALLRDAAPPASADTERHDRRRGRELSAEGDRHFQAGNFDKAFDAYNRALDLIPEDPITLTKRGEIHFRRGHLEQADADFTAALRFDPLLDLALLRRGEVRMRSGAKENAREDLETARRLLASRLPDPEAEKRYADALTGLGQLALKQERFPRALQLLKEALRHHPDNPRVHLFLGLTHLREGRLAEARKEIRCVSELEPTDPREREQLLQLKRDHEEAGRHLQYNLMWASTYLEQGRFPKALESCRKALDIEPAHPETLLLCARARIGMGEPDKALADLEAARRFGAEENDVETWKARAFRALDRFEEAADRARVALQNAPASFEALRELGLALAASRSPDAADVLEKARRLSPRDRETLERLAGLYLEAGENQKAVEAAGDLRDLVPHHLRALEIMALGHLRLGQEEEALRDAARGLALDPGLPGANLVRASRLLDENKAEEALAHARLASTSPTLRLHARRLEARALHRLRRHEALRAVADDILRLRPGDADALLYRARAQLALQDLPGAERDFQRLVDQTPDHPAGLLGLARVSRALSRPEPALAWARKADAADPGPAVWSIMGWALFELGAYARALKALDRTLEAVDPEFPERPRLRLLSAATLRCLGRFAEALARLQGGSLLEGGAARLLEIDLLLDLDRVAEVRKRLGEAGFPAEDPARRWVEARRLLAEGRHEACLATLDGLEEAPVLVPARLPVLHASALRGLGRVREAKALLDEAVEKRPGLWEARWERALTLQRTGATRAMLADLDRVVAWHAGHGRARLLRAEALLEVAERAGEALADLDAAAGLLPEEPRVFRLRSRLRIERGELDKALSDLARLSALVPDSWEVEARRAETAEALFRFQEAARSWERALSRKGAPDAGMEIRRLEAMHLSGRNEACLSALEAAGGASTFGGRGFLLRGRAELALKRYAEAVETAGEAIALAPSLDLEAKCLRARAYLLRGASMAGGGEGNEDFVKAYFDIQAHYPRALREEGLEGPERGRVFTVMGLYQWMAENNRKRAVEDFRRAVNAWPQARGAHRMLGRIAASHPETLSREEGLRHLERALLLSHPETGAIHEDRGRCLEGLGRVEEATGAYRKALKADPTLEGARKRLAALAGARKGGK